MGKSGNGRKILFCFRTINTDLQQHPVMPIFATLRKQITLPKRSKIFSTPKADKHDQVKGYCQHDSGAG